MKQTYQVNAMDLKKLRLLETETVASVLQNIAIILKTPKGSVPMYREFGLSQSFLDRPMPVARNMLISAVKEAIERWEPRAEVVDVTFTGNASNPGELNPIVEVKIIGE